MTNPKRIRRHAMKHEPSVRDFDLELAKGAGGSFLVLIAGLLLSLICYLLSC